MDVVREPTFAGGDGSRQIPAALLKQAAGNAEIYFGFGIAPGVFREAPRLRWVHSAAAGARASLFPEMVESEVIFSNSAGIYAEPLAEWAMAAVLYFARGFDLAVRGKLGSAGGRTRRWRRSGIRSARPQAARWGSWATVASAGRSGGGRRPSACGAGGAVAARRRRPAGRGGRGLRPAGPARGPRAQPFRGAEPAGDAATVGLIDAPELARMRPDSVLLNLSRGGIVDEDALIDALRSEHIRGAALDVFREEPLPADSPLWTLDNVLITPHAARSRPGSGSGRRTSWCAISGTIWRAAGWRTW